MDMDDPDRMAAPVYEAIMMHEGVNIDDPANSPVRSSLWPIPYSASS